jgi:biotin carboxylase
MRSALAETRLDGVATNLSLQLDVLSDPEFGKGAVDTSYLPRFLERRRLLQEA